jgi:hypothetical protein
MADGEVTSPLVTDAGRKLVREAAVKIRCAFAWSQSAEGHEYWSAIEKRLTQMAKDGRLHP